MRPNSQKRWALRVLLDDFAQGDGMTLDCRQGSATVRGVRETGGIQQTFETWSSHERFVVKARFHALCALPGIFCSELSTILTLSHTEAPLLLESWMPC